MFDPPLRPLLTLPALWLLLSVASAETLDRRRAAQIAAERNLDLIIERLERDRSALASEAAWRPFVPELSVDFDYGHRRGAATHAQGFDQEQGFEGEAQVTMRSTLGTSAALAVGHAVSSTHPDSDPFDPRQSPHLTLTLTQPLLRDAGRVGAATDLLLAQVDAQAQRARFVRALNDVLVAVEEAYWALAFSQADVRIKTRSRDRAQQQVDETVENIRRGILAESERYIVEESLLLFEQSRIRAEEARAQAASRLARLLEMPPGQTLVALATLEQADRPDHDPETAVDLGIETSPTLQVARLEARRAEIQLAHHENQTLPALDLTASLGLRSDESSAVDAYRSLDPTTDRGLAVGLSFSIPLGGGADVARIERAQAATRQSRLRLDQLVTDLRFRIHDALRRLSAHAETLKLARKVVGMAKLKLDAEREKYRGGVSTLADVVRFQRELDTALIGERQAAVALNTAQSRLRAAQGVLHQDLGLSVE